MALDVAARAPAASLRERVAAVPAQVSVGGIVAVSFVARLVATFLHPIPLYFPDEYIYGTIARSIAATGRPLIRGGAAHFPALLVPLLDAPLWLVASTELAFHLTQALNAFAMSLAAIPVYLLARRLDLGRGIALVSATLAVASPDLFFSSFALADPIAYPLVLGAVCAGVSALARPSFRSQAAFVALAGLATLARVQYVVLPAAFVVAALVVERGRIRALVRAQRLPLAIFCSPLLALPVLGLSRALGYYSGVTSLKVSAASILHWGATDLMMLAYSAGWVLVPGALAGIAFALFRPADRAERAFGALTVALAAATFGEAALYAASGSDRYQERYLFALLPLVPVAFGLYLKRRRSSRLPIALLATAMLVLSVRVPLSGYTVSAGKQDSPFLFAVFSLERVVGIANGSLAVAVLAALLSSLAVLTDMRRKLVPLALGASVVAGAALSIGSIQFDHLTSTAIRNSYLPADKQWVDNARVGDVTLLQTPASLHARAHELLFFNRSIKGVVLMDGASPLDTFDSPPAAVAPDGLMLVRGAPVVRPVVVSNYAVSVQLQDATRVARGRSWDLWRPRGAVRLSLFLGGRYHDGWLAQAGHLSIWPDASGFAKGTLRLPLWLPHGTETTKVRLRAPGFRQTVVLHPGRFLLLSIPVSARGPWTLRFSTGRPGYLGDGRTISVKAGLPVFTRARAPALAQTLCAASRSNAIV